MTPVPLPVPLSVLWRIARRDLSASFRGLRLLFLCLFLGVAALAAIGSLTAAITGELTKRGRELLGGDIEVALTQRYATDAEKEIMAGLGRVSETVRLRAMAPRPGLIFADEPTGNLDGATSRRVADLLFERRAAAGATLVMITHDPALAARCDRIVEMADGRIVSDRLT